jgi:hypothetical protein
VKEGATQLVVVKEVVQVLQEELAVRVAPAEMVEEAAMEHQGMEDI